MKNFLKERCINDEFIIINYILVNIIVLFAYLFTVTFKCEQFNFDVYRKIYMYYFIFQLVMFSLCIIHFSVNKLYSLQHFIRDFFKISILSLANLPLIISIFIAGNVEILNVWIPMVVQVVYGVAIVTFKQLLYMNKKLSKYINFIIHFVVFFVNVMSLVFLYMYYKYSQIIITTIFDKRIPRIFFLNPLITTAGYINKQITDYSQLGIRPVIWCGVFWGICSIINIFVIKSINNKSGGNKVEMENH